MHASFWSVVGWLGIWSLLLLLRRFFFRPLWMLVNHVCILFRVVSDMRMSEGSSSHGGDLEKPVFKNCTNAMGKTPHKEKTPFKFCRYLITYFLFCFVWYKPKNGIWLGTDAFAIYLWISDNKLSFTINTLGNFHTCLPNNLLLLKISFRQTKYIPERYNSFLHKFFVVWNSF